MGWRLPGLRNDIRYGARRLLHAPSFTVLAVLVLALGVGVNASFFSLVNGDASSPSTFQPVQLVNIAVTAERSNPHEHRVYVPPVGATGGAEPHQRPTGSCRAFRCRAVPRRRSLTGDGRRCDRKLLPGAGRAPADWPSPDPSRRYCRFGWAGCDQRARVAATLRGRSCGGGTFHPGVRRVCNHCWCRRGQGFNGLTVPTSWRGPLAAGSGADPSCRAGTVTTAPCSWSLRNCKAAGRFETPIGKCGSPAPGLEPDRQDLGLAAVPATAALLPTQLADGRSPAEHGPACCIGPGAAHRLCKSLGTSPRTISGPPERDRDPHGARRQPGPGVPAAAGRNGTPTAGRRIGLRAGSARPKPCRRPQHWSSAASLPPSTPRRISGCFSSALFVASGTTSIVGLRRPRGWQRQAR